MKRIICCRVGNEKLLTMAQTMIGAKQGLGETGRRVNRLTNLTHRASDASLLSKYDYTLHLTGRRVAAVEVQKEEDATLSTNTVSWGYDALYRLTNEVLTTSLSYGTYNTTYQYDRVGNRKQRITLQNSGSTTVSYAYNNNDQLLSETTSAPSASSVVNYGYDTNGSLTTKTNLTTGDATAYRYSARNQLRGATISDPTGSSTTSYLYNDAGIRVRATTG